VGVGEAENKRGPCATTFKGHPSIDRQEKAGEGDRGGRGGREQGHWLQLFVFFLLSLATHFFDFGRAFFD